MVNNIIRYSIICFCFLLTSNLFGQEVEKKKQAVYGTFGIISSVYYERTVLDSERADHRIVIGGQLGHQFFKFPSSINNNRNFYYGVHAFGLLGKNQSFVEMGLGVGNIAGFGSGEVDHFAVAPKVSLAYRYELENALIRIGFGLPEFIFLSAGYRF